MEGHEHVAKREEGSWRALVVDGFFDDSVKDDFRKTHLFSASDGRSLHGPAIDFKDHVTDARHVIVQLC